MASKSSTTTTSLIIILLLISLVEADLFASPSPTTNNNFGTCPKDPLQLGVCTSLPRIANLAAGDPRARPCCNAINDIPSVLVTDCLCFVFSPIPLLFTLDETVRRVLVACNRAFPVGFQCPPPPTQSTP